MERALREVLVPDLRRRGFTGSFPHFRRVTAHRVDYLSVQFNSAGGSLVVEIAAAGPDGKPTGHGEHLPIEKLNVTYFAKRLRLGSDPGNGVVDHWFEFGPKSYEPSVTPPEYEEFVRIANAITACFEQQADEWLRTAVSFRRT